MTEASPAIEPSMVHPQCGRENGAVEPRLGKIERELYALVLRRRKARRSSLSYVRKSAFRRIMPVQRVGTLSGFLFMRPRSSTNARPILSPDPGSCHDLPCCIFARWRVSTHRQKHSKLASVQHVGLAYHEA